MATVVALQRRPASHLAACLVAPLWLPLAVAITAWQPQAAACRRRRGAGSCSARHRRVCLWLAFLLLLHVHFVLIVTSLNSR